MKKSILSTKSQLVNLFLGVGTVLVSIAAANPAQANVPCSNLGITQIGDKCYVDVPIYLRVENRRDPANFLDRYEPNPGFLITGHTINVRSRVGDTTGPHTIQKQSGSITVTEEQIKTAEKQTQEFSSKIGAQLGIEQAKLNKLAEIKSRSNKEYERLYQIRRQLTNYGLEISGSAKAVRSATGIGYKSGGTLNAVVRIDQIYLGTPQDLNIVVEKYKRELEELVSNVPPNHNPTITEVLNRIVSFDGAKDYTEIPNNENLNFDTGDLTISAWVKTTSTSGIEVILDKRVEATGPVKGYVLSNYNGDLLLQLADGVANSAGNTWTNYVSDVSIADGNWHHVVVVVDRDQVDGGRWYLDGVEVGKRFNPTNRGGSLSNSKPLVIGRRSDNPGNPGFFKGEIGNVRLAKRALSSQEIQTMTANKP